MEEEQKCVVMQNVEDRFAPYQRLFFAHIASDKAVFEGMYKTLDMRLSLENVADTQEECVEASGSCGAEHVSSSLTGVGCTYAFLQSKTFLAEIPDEARKVIFDRLDEITKVRI
jgi:sulfite reductase beta subunit-like hemoprotein